MPADGRWDLTLILLTWRIWWAPNNASRWQMGFNPTSTSYISTMNKMCVCTEYVIFLDDSSTWRFQRGVAICSVDTANTAITTVCVPSSTDEVAIKSLWSSTDYRNFEKNCTPPLGRKYKRKHIYIWEPEYTCSTHTALSRRESITKAKQWTFLIGIIETCKQSLAWVGARGWTWEVLTNICIAYKWPLDQQKVQRQRT